MTASPGRLRDPSAAIAEVLAELGPDATPEAVAARFEGVCVEAVGDVMELARG